MSAIKTINIVKNLTNGFVKFFLYKKRREFNRAKATQRERIIKNNKIKFIIKKGCDSASGSEADSDLCSDSDSDSDSCSESGSCSDSTKSTCNYNKSCTKLRDKPHKNCKNHHDSCSDSCSDSGSDSGSDISYKIFKLKNKQRYIKKKNNRILHKLKHNAPKPQPGDEPAYDTYMSDSDSCSGSSSNSDYYSDSESESVCIPNNKKTNLNRDEIPVETQHNINKLYGIYKLYSDYKSVCNKKHHMNCDCYSCCDETDMDCSCCSVDCSCCYNDCNNTRNLNTQTPDNREYSDFLKFKNLRNSVNTDTTKNNTAISTNTIREPLELIVPNKSDEQVKLDAIQGQLDNLLSTDVESLTSIVSIDYFDRILDMLNSIKQNINTTDETIRKRLIMILHMIFSFVTTNKTNENLKKNITEITNKYNNLVDKLYPDKKFIQPLSRDIKLNMKLDPVYDLYVKRYGLPKGNLFDNSKILSLKAEMHSI